MGERPPNDGCPTRTQGAGKFELYPAGIRSFLTNSCFRTFHRLLVLLILSYDKDKSRKSFLASVLVSIFQCDAVERFGPKYLVAGCLGWPLGRNRSTGAFSQIRIPEARGRWAPVRGRGCGSAPAEPAYPAIHLAQTRSASATPGLPIRLGRPAEGRGDRGLAQLGRGRPSDRQRRRRLAILRDDVVESWVQ